MLQVFVQTIPSTFAVAAVNDISINDFMAESRVTLVHIDLSYGFSQCATPPFVQLGYTYTQPIMILKQDIYILLVTCQAVKAGWIFTESREQDPTDGIMLSPLMKSIHRTMTFIHL